MQPFNAVVKNGRLTLDAPCDLPEGESVLLIALSDLLEEAEPEMDGDESRLVLEIAQPRRTFTSKAKRIDAAALIEELRAM